MMAVLLLIACIFPAVLGNGLVDHPIVGDKQTILDGTWTLTAPTAQIQTTGEVSSLALYEFATARSRQMPP